jgi:hypothetical protein
MRLAVAASSDFAAFRRFASPIGVPAKNVNPIVSSALDGGQMH